MLLLRMFASAHDSPETPAGAVHIAATTAAQPASASRLSNLLYPLLATVKSPHTDAATTTQALVALNTILRQSVIRVEE